MRSVDQMSADLAKLDAQMGKLRGATTQLSTETKSTGEAMNQLNNVATALGVTFQPLNNQMVLVTRAFQLIKANAPLAAIASVGIAAAALSKHFSELGVEMGKVARQTGLSTETLSGLKVIAEGNEVSFGELTVAMRFFNRTVGQAALGSQEALDVFKQLGISARQVDEGLAEPEKLLPLVARGFAAVGSTAESTALQFRLFGRGGRDITAVLQELNEKGLDAARQKAADLGQLWTKDMVAAAKVFNDSITHISQALGGLVIYIGAYVLPVVQRLLDLFLKLPQPIKETGESARQSFQAMLDAARQSVAVLEAAQSRGSSVTKELEEQRARVAAIEALLAKATFKTPTAPVAPAIEPKLTPDQQRALDDFARNIRRQIADTLTRLDTSEPFTATILGTRQIDQAIEDFVAKLPEKLRGGTFASLKPLRDQFTEALFKVERDKLDQLAREGLAAANKAATEAAISGIDIDEAEIAADALQRQQEITQILATQQTSIRHDAELFGAAAEATAIILQNQLAQYRLMSAPVGKILEVTRQLDDLERRRVQNLILTKEQERALLKLRVDGGTATAAQLREYENINAELEVLNAKLKTAGQLTAQELVNLENTTEQLASGLAKDFTDRFIALMKDQESRWQDYFANLGETVVSQFMQAALAKLVEQPLLDLLTQVGGKEVEKYKAGGIGGIIFGALKEAISPSAATPGGAANLNTAGITLNTAGTNLNTAAVALETAAASLHGGGVVNGGTVFTPVTQGITATLEEQIQSVLTESGGSDLLDQFTEDFVATFEAMSASLGDFTARSPTEWDSLFGSIMSGFGSFSGSMLDGFSGLFNSITSLFSSLGGSSEGGFGGLLDIFGSVGSFFGFAHGGMVVPRGVIRPFQHGGVTNGPVLGMIGEEGPEIVARMKPARAGDLAGEQAQPRVQVIIEGDITPRRPEMTPEDVIKIVVNNGARTSASGVGGMVRSIIKREK